jgi:hypothetical protein
MSANLPKLRFIGHGGERYQPKNASGKVMFIPDANLVLSLRSQHCNGRELPPSYRDYLAATRKLTQKYWHQREQWIPVNPTFAALELSKQDRVRNEATFISCFSGFLSDIYRINNVDPRWIVSCFEATVPLLDSFFVSLENTVTKLLQLMPTSSPNNQELETLVNALCDWLEDNADALQVTGGELLYLGVYAFAGSPQARRLLKTDQATTKGIDVIARNVAWDHMYLIHRELSYRYQKYDDDIICTADDALADLIAARTNRGLRHAPSDAENLIHYQAYGEFTPFLLPRLEGDTRFLRKLMQRLNRFFVIAARTFDVVPTELKDHYRGANDATTQCDSPAYCP